MTRAHQAIQRPSLFRPALLTAALLWLAPNLAAQITTHTVSAGPDTVTVTVKATVTGKKAAVIVKDPIFNRRVDTVRVGDSVPPPPPPPPTGTTYFLADAESGTVTPPWTYVTSTGGRYSPVNSTTRAKHGTRSIKYEVPGGTADPYSQTLKGEFGTGYYSFYVYVDEGYTVNNAWNMLLGWMTSKPGAPSPIGHIGLEVRGGVLQVTYVQKNCSIGLYPCPTIPGYTQSSGWYLQTASSPNGITAVPRGQWVHFSVYYKMAATNGQVTIWQDGMRVMDLTAPTLNTWGGSLDLSNPTGKTFLQFGVYGLLVSETRRIYVDDFRVSDYRPVP